MGEQECKLQGDNALFGDPCYGKVKRLAVQASCRRHVQPSVGCQVIAENTAGDLVCPAGTVISEIIFASYGTASATCGEQAVSSCHAANSEPLLTDLCVGQERCRVLASNRLFGDPCYGAYKRLVVQYGCTARATKTDALCKAVTQCGPGEVEAIKPSASSDRRCDACPADTFKRPGEDPTLPCHGTTPCAAGQYQRVAGTATSDRICAPVPNCKAGTWESVKATPTSEAECEACRKCPVGHRQTAACTGTSNTQCAQCKSCSAGTFPAVPCSSDGDTQCKPCTVCSPGEYESAPCTASPGSDRACAPVTVCSPGEIEIAKPSFSTNRLCQPCPPAEFSLNGLTCVPYTACAAGSTETAPLSRTSDRSCGPCPAGSADINSNSTCTPCAPGSYTPPGRTSCGLPCEVGTTDDDQDPATPCTACDGVNGYSSVTGATGRCTPVTDCAAGEEEAQPPNPFADRSCAACSAGTFKENPGQDTRCVPVAAPCPPGKYQSSTATASSNRICTACRSSTFKDETGPGPCRPPTRCRVGWVTEQHPTLTSDTVCRACILGQTYVDSFQGDQCMSQPTCSASEYESTAPTLTSARRCSPLSPACVANKTFEAIPPAANRDRLCLPCTTCFDGKQPQTACTPLADTICTDCISCKADEYDAAKSPGCGDGQPRVCRPCSKCTDTQFERAPCANGRNRQCSALTVCVPGMQYEAGPRSATSDRTCAALSTCEAGTEYELKPAKPLSDRTCASVLPKCPDGSKETAAPSPSTNRQCEPCAAGTSWVDGECVTCGAGQGVPASGSVGPCEAHACAAGTYDDDGKASSACKPCPPEQFQNATGQTACLPVRQCNAGEEMLVDAMAARDRVCQPCVLGQSYKAVSGHAVSCQAAQACAPGLYEATVASLTSDRTCLPCPPRTFKASSGQTACMPVSQCYAGQEVVADPSASTDRRCQDCELGITYDNDASAATACVATSLCPDGHGETHAATRTSDRTCGLCRDRLRFMAADMPQPRCVRVCGDLQRQVAEPTASSDRVCETSVSLVFPGSYPALAGTPTLRTAFTAELKQALLRNGVDVSKIAIGLAPGSVVATIVTTDPDTVAQLEGSRCSSITLTLPGSITLTSKKDCTSAVASSSSGAESGLKPWHAAVLAVAVVAVVVVAVVAVRRRHSGEGNTKTLAPARLSALGAVRFSSAEVEGAETDEGGRVAFANPLYDSNPLYGADLDGYQPTSDADRADEDEDGAYHTLDHDAFDGGDDGGYMETTGAVYDNAVKRLNGAGADSDGDEGDGGYMTVNSQA